MKAFFIAVCNLIVNKHLENPENHWKISAFPRLGIIRKY